ncbi:MAG: peptidase M4 [Oleibacter sp.]|nr:peptidase M4 [Thalassolituus sp.]
MNILLIFLALVAGTTNAEQHPNQTQVREWVAAGDMLSLDVILQRHPINGELLDAEIEWEDERLVYELKWLDSAGLRHETYIDAKSGDWIEEEIDD